MSCLQAWGASLYAASAYADGYGAGACVYVGAVGAGVEDNSSPDPSPARAPSLAVARQTVRTQVRAHAHAQSPRATGVVTHCLVAAEGPHHVLDRVLTSGEHLSLKAQVGVFLELGAAWVAAANVGADTGAGAGAGADVGADVGADAGAGAGADAGVGAGADIDACLVAPVLRAPDGSSHQTFADVGLKGGSALLAGAGDR